MKRLITATAAALTLAASAAYSQAQFGTESEAKAMLDKAVANLNARGAPAAMTDRDLYLFCANAGDGSFTVHPTLMGTNMKDVTDKNGKRLGSEIFTTAKEGQVGTISYYWPRPGADTTPVEKVSFFTKVSDQVCGVGYYK